MAAGWLVACLVIVAGGARGMAGEGGATARERYAESTRLEKLADYKGAIQALAGAPKGYILDVRLGWLHYLSGDYAGSRRHYQSGMQAAPASVEAKLGYLLPLLARGAYTEVEKVAKQILRVDSGNYYGNLRLAYALYMQRKYAPAEEVTQRMLRLYPSDTYFLATLGFIKLAQKDRAAARKAFETILLVDPDSATAKQQLRGPGG